MVALAENNAYIKLDTVEVQAYFKEVSIQPSNSAVDITAGAGTDDVQRAPGLNDHKFSATLSYDLTNVQSYIQKIKVGQVVVLDYGPESNTAGKPRHTQAFVITAADHTVSVDKSHVTFSVSGEGAAAPTNNMYAGAIW